MSIICKYCGSERIIKYGLVNEGHQRYKCKECSKSYTLTERKYSFAFKLKVIKWYLEGVGIRSIERQEKVSNPLIIYWIKQFASIIRNKFRSQKVSTDLRDIEILEVDELCSYVKKKTTGFGYGLLLIEDQVKLLVWK